MTTQQIADRADIAIGTLYLYAATKAELLIMVQNQKFATAIATLLARDARINREDAATLAQVITAILHLSTTATVYIDRNVEEVLTDIREQIQSTLAQHHRGDEVSRSW